MNEHTAGLVTFIDSLITRLGRGARSPVRRSLTPVSAWPAIADLMTLFAIVGLVAAAVFWTQAGVRGGRGKTCKKLGAARLQDELDYQKEEATVLRNQVERLKQSLAEEEKNAGHRPAILLRRHHGERTESLPCHR